MKNFGKNQNMSHYGFTLIEMVIVLIIMWILLMLTVWLSWQQIQKVKDKTVKESILAEMQSRYSRNLWSSSIRWNMYNDMEVYRGLLFGKVMIDTVKEELVLSNISKKALVEIETNVSEFMMKEKRRYKKKGE